MQFILQPGQTWKDTKESRAVGLPHCQFATRFAKCNSMDLLLFAQPGPNGIKSGELLQLRLNSDLRNLAPAAVSILLQIEKSRWTNAKIGPWLQNPIWVKIPVQFWLWKQIQRFVNWRGYCEVSEGGASWVIGSKCPSLHPNSFPPPHELGISWDGTCGPDRNVASSRPLGVWLFD